MTSDKTPRISTRKSPKQARSSALVSTILEAAIQVLASEGAQRFTTARVAERAGVSVGSVYQYFPNKASILFKLQSEEWQQTTNLLAGILGDTSKPPLERLRSAVLEFIKSECAEADMRQALDDAAPIYRDAPEAQEAKQTGNTIFLDFIEETLPGAPSSEQFLVADLITNTLSSLGKSFSNTKHNLEEIQTYANAVSDMFCLYLSGIKTRF